MTRTAAALAIAAALLSSEVQAQDTALTRLQASGQWTAGARLALAQALWGEAGIRSAYARTRSGRVVACDDPRAAGPCYPNRDWRIIPWVLAVRWDYLRGRGHRVTFERLVRSYCASVKPRLATAEREAQARSRGDARELDSIRRRRFLIAIRWDGSNLGRLHRLHGHGSPLALYERGWSEITALVEAFGRGEVLNEWDRARHWDHRGARPSWEALRRLDYGETLNAFYCVRGDSC